MSEKRHNDNEPPTPESPVPDAFRRAFVGGGRSKMGKRLPARLRTSTFPWSEPSILEHLDDRVLAARVVCMMDALTAMAKAEAPNDAWTLALGLAEVAQQSDPDGFGFLLQGLECLLLAYCGGMEKWPGHEAIAMYNRTG